MKPVMIQSHSDRPPLVPATITQTAERAWKLSGNWTVRGLGELADGLGEQACPSGEVVLEGAGLEAIDTAGAWLLQRWLRRHGALPALRGWPPRLETLMALVQAHPEAPLLQAPRSAALARVGKRAVAAWLQTVGLLAFVGETALAALRLLVHPTHIRWRTLLRNVQIGGFEALPIIGLTSFLLGVVVAYQGADQLRHYGANIFVVELVGYSMLREFAPLITAIIIAGRSGSAYAAQIGTMLVTEEIDAMRTLGIEPIELLVLPKLMALCRRAAAADRVRRRDRRHRRHAHGAGAARRRLRRVHRPLRPRAAGRLATDRHRQGARCSRSSSRSSAASRAFAPAAAPTASAARRRSASCSRSSS